MSKTAIGSFLPTSSSGTPKTKLKCSLVDFEKGVTLGTGTFGRVRLVQYLPAKSGAPGQNYYAMKIMKKNEIIRLQQVAHIKSEVGLLAQLDHPFIVNLVAHLQDAEKVYLILEYVSGGELFTHLRNTGRITNSAAMFYSSHVVLAFGYLHALHIAYRDLKPENLLITTDGNIKIADFGFAKVVVGRTWTLCGTPEYLAPEIIQSKGHGTAVDCWALGVLIYEMICGYPPFCDENPFGIYQKILQGSTDYPSHMNRKAVSLIQKLLQHDLSKRLGCLKGGISEIQQVKWFSSFNWKAAFSQTLTPPYVPETRGEADTSNFDEYPESPEAEPARLSSADLALFDDFGGCEPLLGITPSATEERKEEDPAKESAISPPEEKVKKLNLL